MKKVHLLLFAVLLVLTGCSSNSENPITHLPFKTEKDGRWGLIDMEGNILLEDEFKHRPSVVIDGMFCVKNSDGMYELYTAEQKPRQIGEEYLYVGYFANGLAPVVEKDSRITYINKEGKVVIKLTKYNNDPVVKAESFNNGIALVETASGMAGAIDTKGKFVVPPIYTSISYAGENILLIRNDEGKVGYITYKGKTMVEPKYSYGYSFDAKGYAKVGLDEKHILIDKTGKEIIKFSNNMKIIGECSDENLIPYCLDDKSYGYMNLKGEIVIKLPSNIEGPSTFFNGYATFRNSDLNYGIINTKGEIVIRAKYDELVMYDDYMLYRDNNEWGFISYSGDIIKRACYKEIVPFFNKNTFAKDGDDWILIDQKGEDTKKVNVETIYFDNYDFGYSYSVESDYLDIDAEVENIMSVLNEDGTIDKMTFNMTPREFENEYANPLVENEQMIYTLPSSKYMNRGYFQIFFNGNIKIPNYDRQWVDSRWGGYWDNVIIGYSYNDSLKARLLTYSYELKGKLLNKKQNVYESMLLFLKNKGYELVKQEDEGDLLYYHKKDTHTLIMQVHNDFVNIMTTKIEM